MTEHKPAAEVIIETEEFLLEHSRLSDRPPIQERVRQFQELFEATAESVQEYVDNMESALPLWEEFNQYQARLSDWLVGADQTYSNQLQSGDAIITERSLRNAEVGSMCIRCVCMCIRYECLCMCVCCTCPNKNMTIRM